MMACGTERFDALASALYGGQVKAADFKTMPGADVEVDREAMAYALLSSMERLGIVKDGSLVNLAVD